MKKRAFTLATVLLSAGHLHAQSTTDKAKPLAKPVNNNQTVTVSEAMRKNNGSLFRATLQTQAEPGQATLKDVSFMAVPDPEPRVLKKHDIVTVIVREESAFKAKGTSDLKRQSELEARLEEFIRLDLKNFEIEGGALGANPPSIAANSNRTFKGEGSVDRQDSMTARIAAEIVDVKPNGTLVLQGKKTIKNDDEIQEFIITGIARAADVTADNSILSTNLFDLSLEKKNKGSVRDASKRGWVTKLLDAINPF